MRIIFKDGSILDANNVEKIIVNSDEECKAADEYVRDQLLIQFCMHYLDPYYNKCTVEDLYDAWMTWLKEKEVEHAERSKI